MEQFLQRRSDTEQISAARKMSDLARTYMPLTPAVFTLESDFIQPWLKGFSAHRFRTYWKYMDIDLAERHAGK